jgi:hypothetical protein
MFFRRSLLIFGTLFILAFIDSSAWAQANVNENLETATLYVDATKGSDSNPGTQLQPLETIAKAASLALTNNQQSVGTRVIINPGTYREAIAINKGYKNTNSPITFQAATTGKVIVSGADVWTGWTESGSLYTHPWSYQWGTCAPDPTPAPAQQEILLRQEEILIDGTPLTQMLSKSAMQPGTFFADESKGTVYVWPPSGTNMSAATVEVATRPSLFSDQSQSDVVVRGLTFQYANSCRGNAAVTVSGSATNVLVDTDTFDWNNGVALSLMGTQNFTVQSSTANHNGQKGFATHQVKYGSWQSDTANYNNWRGAQAAFYTYDAGSVRLFLDHNSTFNNLVTLFNQTQGVHFDTDNENVTITSQVSANNLYGMLLEKSQGPFTVSNSYFCGNNVMNQSDAGGVSLRNSTNVTLTGNKFYANLVNQFTLNGIAGGIEITNWETGQSYNLLNERITLSKNTIATASNTAHTFYDSYLGGSAWTDFVTTLSSDDNTWSAGTDGNPFMVPAPKTGSVTSFVGWQALTLQDLHSTMATSSTEPTECKVQPDAPDYWLITTNLTPVTASASGQASFSLNTASVGGLTGTVNLTVDGLSAIPGATASFTPASITTSGASVLTVTTKSNTTPGTYPVTAIANTGNLTRTVTVSIVVPKTSVRLSSSSLTFAAQKVGTTSAPQKITVTNTGSTALSISTIAVGKNFGETNTCGIKLNAGASCTVSVTFSPVYIGTPTGTLSISDGDPTSPQTVSLSGTGLAK